MKQLFYDFLALTTAPELLFRALFNQESLENGNISKYAKWVYDIIGELEDVEKN